MGILIGHSLASSIMVGVTSGVVMIFLLTGVYYGIRKYFLKLAGSTKVDNYVELEVEGEREEILDICSSSISQVHKGKILRKDTEKGTITAKTGINRLTWGDLIQFEITQSDSNKCDIKISSRPKVKATVIDYGKNLDNINKISDYIGSKTAILNRWG